MVRNELKLAGCVADVDVAEFDGYPYMMTVLARTRSFSRPTRKKNC